MAIVSLVLKDTQWLLRMETQGQILNILYFISIADIKIGPLDISWPLLYILYFSTIKALCIFQLVDKTVLITAKALLVLQFGMFLLMSLHAFAVAPYNPSVSSF
ncbi:hypothetical protein ENBRE01_1620 [Enteropsectra breve]|nr:hypothetical protein ENBRE01_1620 [Enteropsectra breve]